LGHGFPAVLSLTGPSTIGRQRLCPLILRSSRVKTVRKPYGWGRRNHAWFAGYDWIYPLSRPRTEITGKVFNGNATPRHFLWWANPAVKGGDAHQSVFPPDVTAVFDHGKRDVSAFLLPRALI
jgi:hypothetical protein